MMKTEAEQPQSLTGQLDVLNCGEGHLEITFKENDPVETARAEHVIADMLKRGYALFIQGKGKALTRVHSFDAQHRAYIIAAEATEPAEAMKQRGRPRKTEAVPIHTAKAVAIGRSAGG